MFLQGHIVTVEITSGNVYRGKLLEGTDLQRQTEKTKQQDTDDMTAEDNMNCQLRDITVTARDGRVSHLDQVYIRGSHVRYFIVPDMLRFVESNGIQGRSYADNYTTEMRPCSEQETFAEEVLVWPEVALLSAEPEAKEVDPADKWASDKHLVLIMNTRKRESQKFYVGRVLWL
jgi:small nuclear ribonucleoprotein D3